jgi:hypothetical protein
MSHGDLRRRLAALERFDEQGFLLFTPRAADVSGQLRAPLGAGGYELEGGDAGQQCAQHFGFLENRARRQLLARRRVHTLDQGLKNVSGLLFLHEIPSLSGRRKQCERCALAAARRKPGAFV